MRRNVEQTRPRSRRNSLRLSELVEEIQLKIIYYNYGLGSMENLGQNLTSLELDVLSSISEDDLKG